MTQRFAKALAGCLLACIAQLGNAAGDDTIEINLQYLKPGELISVLTDRQPVWIVHRTSTALGKIDRSHPSYDQSMDAAALRNKYRSLRKEYFVVIGGCPGGTELPAYDRNEGFSCIHSGKKYDLAGRPLNGAAGSVPMRLPHHHFNGEHSVVIHVGPNSGT